MIPLLLSGILAYYIYNTPWNDLMYYCEMKTQEYMGIYHYEYDEDEVYDVVDTTEVSLLDNMYRSVFDNCVGLYFNGLTIYCEMEKKWDQIVKTNSIAYFVNHIIRYLWNGYKRMLSTHLIEPDSNIWVDNISMYRVKEENGAFIYNIMDSYMYPYPESHCLSLSQVKDRMALCFQKHKKMPVNEEYPAGIIQVIAHLVISKFVDEQQHTRYIVSTKNIPDTIVLSDAKFMSVEYVHPQMTESIPLHVPNDMLVSGNVLFTPAFVLRALKHQTEPFHFDMDYRIKVMDAMVNIFEIKSDECMVLHAHGYDVKPTKDV